LLMKENGMLQIGDNKKRNWMKLSIKMISVIKRQLKMLFQ